MRSSQTILLAVSRSWEGLFRVQDTIDMGCGSCEQREATGAIAASRWYEEACYINTCCEAEEEEPSQSAEAEA